MENVTPSATPAPSAPMPAQPAAPVAPQPPAPQPPVSTPASLEDGGAVNKIDWVGWIFMALGVTALTLIIWERVKRAKESKKISDTQETLSAKVAAVESKASMIGKNPYGGLIM